MSDDRPQAHDCLDAETLAAFIDGRLEPREREAVEAHLAACEDCYEVWMEGMATVAESIRADGSTAPPRTLHWRGWYAAAAVAAVVTLATVLTLPRGSQIDRSIKTLVEAVGNDRFTEARLSEPFQWGTVPSALRGPSGVPDLTVQIAALKLREIASSDLSASGHRAAGLSYVVTGDIEAAVTSLEQAVALDPTLASARIDLSAALFERWKAKGHSEDLGKVLEHSGAVLATQPDSATALFNQALVWTAMNVQPRALEAWQAFLRVESSGPWADEARGHIQRLGQGSAPGASTDYERDRSPFGLYTWIEGTVLPEWARNPDAPTSRAALAVAVAQARALAASGRDTYLLTLASAAEASPLWPAARREALRQGVGSLYDWRKRLDDGDYYGAESTAAAALAFLTTAGVDTAEAELEVAYSALVGGRRVDALALLAPLQTRATARGFFRIAARAGRLRALAAMLDTRVAEAQERYETALALAQRSADLELESLLNAFLAEAYAAMGDPRTAWTHLVAALQPFPSLVTQRQRFDALSTAASVSRRTGLHEASLLFGAALLDSTRQWTNPEGQIGAHLHIARALTQLSRGDRGITNLEGAAALLPNLQSRPQAQARLAAEIAFAKSFAFAESDDRVALAAADEAVDFFGATVRVRLAELLLQRGRLHARLGQVSEARADWVRGIDIVEDQRPALRNEILRVSRTASLWDLYTEAIAITSDDPATALDLAERARARELLFSLDPSRVVQRTTVAEAQQLLPDGAVAIVYTQLPGRLLVWSVTADDIRLTERIVSAAQLASLIDVFIEHLDDGPTSQSARALARELLPSGLQLRADRPLVIVPDGELFRVPFAALPLPGTGRVIVEVSVPVVAPSLSTFAWTSRATTGSTARRVLAIGVGDAVPADGLHRLLTAEAEAATVAAEYREHLTLVGSAANRASVLAALPLYNVVHFAGHSATDRHFPLNARLYVDRGAVAAADISGLSLRPQTVAILGACDTALGANYHGEGPFSLVRAFLAAGASGVVATLWRVRDGDAASVLRPLHAHLAAGGDLAFGLAQSQRSLVARGVPVSTWSAYSVVGGFNNQRMR